MLRGMVHRVHPVYPVMGSNLVDRLIQVADSAIAPVPSGFGLGVVGA